jgi:hypothetical protein
MKNAKQKYKNYSKEDYDEVFKEYIEVCNKAITANNHKFPYKGLLDVCNLIWKDHDINLAIYDDRPKATYSMHLDDDQIIYKEENPEKLKKRPWKINLSYMEKVIGNPEKYIKHPERLDMDWLSSRMFVNRE